MATTLGFKDIIDLPMWRPLTVAPNASSTATGGFAILSDLRNSEDRNPHIFYVNNNQSCMYNIKNDGWNYWPAGSLSFVQGSGGVFVPSKGPSGTLASGWTANKGAVTTAFSRAPGVNSLANRGDGRGHRIRIIGNSAGGSGKTEEVLITGNTSSTTPTIRLESSLSFTPQSGDRYELLSGKIYWLGSSVFHSVDIANEFLNTSLSTSSIPTSSGSMRLVVHDELYVPHNRKPGEGYVIDSGVTYNNGNYNCLQATATSGTSITGHSAGGDSAVIANQYRNFQIRIVEDTTAPTAVGQRRNITSHTAGTSPVYTVPTWTVTPSSNAKYVIEGNGDRIIAMTSGVGTVWAYYINGNTGEGTANTWSNSRFTASPSSNFSLNYSLIIPFAIVPDADNNSHPGMMYFYGQNGAMSVLDMTAATNGTWTNSIAYTNIAGTTGSPGTGNSSLSGSSIYDGATNEGRYAYLSLSSVTSQVTEMKRIDFKNRCLEPWVHTRYPVSSAATGQFLATALFIDGSTKLQHIVHLRPTTAELTRCEVIR